MSTELRSTSDLVLALYPTTTGFGWAVFRGAVHAVDWGTAYVVRSRNSRSTARIRELIERFRPSEIVLEQFEGSPAHRSSRIRHLYRSIIALAKEFGIQPRVFTREVMETVFAKVPAKTRYEIAAAIAFRIPDLAHLLPPQRKIWLAEDPRMGLFNAAALAITFFALVDGEPFAK